MNSSAWRGFFPFLGEKTNNIPDLKEGLYFGKESNSTRPMHGLNYFILNTNHQDIINNADLIEFKNTVLEYMTTMTNLGTKLFNAISLSLKLEQYNLYNLYIKPEPTILFRIFKYPPKPNEYKNQIRYGVGEHTDYGLITILKQDHYGGLQVKNTNNKWINAPYINNTFFINIGDMLERMTNGYYISTPHRVQSHNELYNRFSFPSFMIQFDTITLY